MSGPFLGARYLGEVKSSSVSELKLSNSSTVSAYMEKSISDPILQIKTEDGEVMWTWALIPQLPGKSNRECQITFIRLNKEIKEDNQVKILISCDWTGGGKESGVVYLDQDYQFKNFALSW